LGRDLAIAQTKEPKANEKEDEMKWSNPHVLQISDKVA
jgi:hypothetical protein